MSRDGGRPVVAAFQGAPNARPPACTRARTTRNALAFASAELARTASSSLAAFAKTCTERRVRARCVRPRRLAYTSVSVTRARSTCAASCHRAPRALTRSRRSRRGARTALWRRRRRSVLSRGRRARRRVRVRVLRRRPRRVVAAVGARRRRARGGARVARRRRACASRGAWAGCRAAAAPRGAGEAATPLTPRAAARRRRPGARRASRGVASRARPPGAPDGRAGPRGARAAGYDARRHRARVADRRRLARDARAHRHARRAAAWRVARSPCRRGVEQRNPTGVGRSRGVARA